MRRGLRRACFYSKNRPNHKISVHYEKKGYKSIEEKEVKKDKKPLTEEQLKQILNCPF